MRSFFRRSRDALIVAFAAGTFMVFAFALLTLLPLILERLPLEPAMRTAASLARWPALALLCIAGLGMLYRFARCRRAAKWRWVGPGAAAGMALWLAGSTGFSFYISHFPSYNHTLGPLGTIMMMLIRLYLSAFAVLLGAALNAELERQPTKDATTDQPAAWASAAPLLLTR